MKKLIAAFVAGAFALAGTSTVLAADAPKKDEMKKEAAAPAKKEEMKKEAAPKKEAAAKKEAAPKKEAAKKEMKKEEPKTDAPKK